MSLGAEIVKIFVFIRPPALLSDIDGEIGSRPLPHEGGRRVRNMAAASARQASLCGDAKAQPGLDRERLTAAIFSRCFVRRYAPGRLHVELL